MQGVLLTSFGFRTLDVLRAVKAGTPLDDTTKERLCNFGFATMAQGGAVSLTMAGIEMLDYLEHLALVLDEHAEFIEVASGSVKRQIPKR